ncbi:XRE family transcriptional regulator [Pelagicoccus sp. SDUM812003]|uniref:helix-turn-helix domain-containing protein n=1 Tax=Pelagicoccus sp. SDUM812003 TaxID=3041267 RepID=UPI002811A492|nr:XRE family transcriptional regulator [Pelagicoccus sp. SDUM812003]
MDSLSRLIGERVKLARQEAKLSQEKLSHTLDFKDRQTLSTIENGQRRVSAEELVQFSEALRKPLDYFTDPYLVAGEKAFSYRSLNASETEIADFEYLAGSYIATHRRFQELLEQTASPAQAKISSIGEKTPLDFATYQGERCAAAWDLGDVPTKRLREAVTQELGIQVLYVDAPASISGAACRLDDGAYILINRNEPNTRQNFDIGHELFHLLTWDKLPPARLDLVIDESEIKKKRPAAEKLADAFTAGLLMPSETMRQIWARRGDQDHEEWITQTADQLGVSPMAVYWRMVNLRVFKKTREAQQAAAALRGKSVEARPQLFSPEFVGDLYKVLERGAITVRKALKLLDIDQEELEDLFASYKLKPPFEL